MLRFAPSEGCFFQSLYHRGFGEVVGIWSSPEPSSKWHTASKVQLHSGV